MKRIIGRIISIAPALCIQALWYAAIFSWLKPHQGIIDIILSILSFLFVLYVITKRDEGTYKTLWLLIILSLPLLGAFLYLCYGNKRTAKPLGEKLKRAKQDMPSMLDDSSDFQKLEQQNKRVSQTFHYLQNKTGLPVIKNQNATYYPVGEKMFEAMLCDLKKAKKYIFVEYFIVEEGKFFNSLIDIMEEKVTQGVDVRIMYDDFGSLTTYSFRNLKKLKEKGIKCIPFNPLIFLRGTLNNRDHRKMLIIDGEVAFTGGVNLADEYINEVKRFGHWKDIGFRLEGPAVKNYVYMFSEFWNAFSTEKVPKEYISRIVLKSEKKDGYVLSYYDSPVQKDAVSNNLYIELLSQATKYAYFYTPYLMLGDTLMDAFVRAAQRGVDIRIIMPGIPDKKIVFRLSRSYYSVLMEAGIKIYEYTPGFVHAKGCVIDGVLGTIGTVNLDYRSLFLHFENNSLFYQASILKDLEEDFLATQEKSHEVTRKDMRHGVLYEIFNGILRIFAPLC